MFFFTHSSIYVGIEKTSQGLFVATLVKKSKRWEIASLRQFSWEENVNPLDKLPKDTIVSTALSSREVLVRSLEMPLKKEKDLVAALPFQMEPHLPYPVEKCILQKTISEEHSNGTVLTVFSAKKEMLAGHLEQWKPFSIDPDCVTCAPQALAYFSTFLSSTELQLILHLGEKEGTCVLAEKGLVLSARPVNKDLHDIQKTVLSMTTSLKSKKIESLLFLGEDTFFAEKLQEILEKKITYLKIPSISDENLQKFGLAIGIAMAGGEERNGINFRQHEFAYPRPWKKIKKPFLTFCAVASLFLAATIGLTQLLIHKEDKRIEQEFLALLAFQGKKEEKGLSKEEMRTALDHLEKEIEGRPNTFPLLPVIPKVSDLLAWISSLPLFSHYDDSSFGIDRFYYTLEKRPDFSHRQEHYLVKVELEFSTANPTLARNFHEALQSPNPFVDPKKDIQWTPGKNKYLVSFYLKDKTHYY